ncbi:sulfite exporter TauE/SafE family protein [Candidatus Zixiibacteriota bacterium]
MELWTAFIFGLLGSLHCIGMCGPIAIALPGMQASRVKFTINRLVYNFGRIISYSILGAICGWIGQTIKIAGYQAGLSVFSGIIILLMVFLPSKFAGKIIKFKFYYRMIDRTKTYWGTLFRKSSTSSFLLIGFLNGFLPCGLVYVALAASATTGSSLNGLLYMVMFGLGTIPIMLAVSYLGLFVNLSFKRIINRLIPVGAVLIAMLIILRGLSLGIPYISPEIKIDASGEQKVNCCPKPEK